MVDVVPETPKSFCSRATAIMFICAGKYHPNGKVCRCSQSVRFSKCRGPYIFSTSQTRHVVRFAIWLSRRAVSASSKQTFEMRSYSSSKEADLNRRDAKGRVVTCGMSGVTDQILQRNAEQLFSIVPLLSAAAVRGLSSSERAL